ncbi:MAG: thiol-disulfide isomerase/thioredoxin [Sphingobacteriales bacterium]|jgi:thiol-disulfide isomerase/thioredoxin
MVNSNKQNVLNKAGLTSGTIFLILLLFSPLCFYGKEAKITFELRNSNEEVIFIDRKDYQNPGTLFNEEEIEIPVIKGKATLTLDLSNPIFIEVYFRKDTSEDYSSLIFFISPDDNLTISIDALSPIKAYTASGIGSENNHPLIQPVINYSLKTLNPFRKDSLPQNVINEINTTQKHFESILNEYVEIYKPSPIFIDNLSKTIEYFPLKAYVWFKGTQGFKIWGKYYRNEKKWLAVEDSLKDAIKLCDDEMINMPIYSYFIPWYVIRTLESFNTLPEILSRYYTAEEIEKGAKYFSKNLLKERIINTDFKGNSREILYANLMKFSYQQDRHDDLPEIYLRFKEQHPTSIYLSIIQPWIKEITENQKKRLTKNMIIIEDADSLQTFDDILNMVKGKTVLLDMWGTWCGPCRSSFDKNLDSIKARFKNENLEYLFIANHDLENRIKWKELIAYYQLTGTHFLANKNLTEDIFNTLKRSWSYPTYIIINKDGSFKESQSGSPMDRTILYKEIEDAL